MDVVLESPSGFNMKHQQAWFEPLGLTWLLQAKYCSTLVPLSVFTEVSLIVDNLGNTAWTS